ncbi:MAG: CDP-glycerol glycerophosphotransferase family protein [Lachnospiraceae bacterium]
MQLQQLTNENFTELISRNIVCYERSDNYLLELESRFPSVYRAITGIVDDYKRNQGYVCLGEEQIPVLDTTYLLKLDYTQSVILITSDYYLEAYEKLESIPEVVANNEIIYFFPNQETEYELYYREQFHDDELRELVIFRSGPHASAYVRGMDFADNARAVFEYMIANNYNEKYEIVWFVKYPDEFKEYEAYHNVKFYSFDWSVSKDIEERDKYYDVLCHAKYIFFTDAYGFARNCRNDQIRIQLWHGCGFKTRTNFISCETRYDYNIVISQKYKEIHKEIYGLRDDQVLITGYPKEDLLFHPITKDKLKVLGIPECERYIFWMPTFRTASEQLKILNEHAIESEVGLPILYQRKDMERLNQILCDNQMIMIIKLHPFQKKNSVSCGHLSNIVLLENEQLVEQDIQVNELLGWADALISDYSSAAIDYLILNRPLAFTLDDVEEYSSNRGFVFDNIRDWLPGKEIFSVDDFLCFVEEIGKGIDSSREKRENIRNILHQFDDDKNSKRVLDVLEIEK